MKRALKGIGVGVAALAAAVGGYLALAPEGVSGLQGRLNAAAPGSTVVAQAGTYSFTTSGTATGLTVNRGVVLDMNGAIFKGPGASTATSGTSKIVAVTGGATLRNGSIEGAANYGVYVQGGTLEELTIRDTSENGVAFGSGSTIRYVEAHNSRAYTGIGTENHGSGTSDSLIYRCIVHDNGRNPDGSETSASGNSDGSGTTKDCEDTASHCYRDRWFQNISYRNGDDGFDVSVRDAVFTGNISYGNGPQGRKGFKMLRKGTSDFHGNVAAGPTQDRGIEFRELEAGHHGWHNLAFGPAITDCNKAFYTGADVSGASVDIRASICPPNHSSQIANPGFVPQLWSYTYPAPTVQARWAALYESFRQAYQAVGSAVDAGKVIAGYHCPSSGAGDGSCVEWLGSAPDLGPFEGGMVSSPPPSPPPTPTPEPSLPAPSPTPTPSPTPSPSPSSTPTPSPTTSPSPTATPLAPALGLTFPTSVSVPRGTTGTITGTLKSVGGFAGTVAVSVAPVSAAIAVSPSSVLLQANGSAVVTVKIVVPSSAPVGQSAPVTVTVKSGALAKSASILATVS